MAAATSAVTLSLPPPKLLIRMWRKWRTHKSSKRESAPTFRRLVACLSKSSDVGISGAFLACHTDKGMAPDLQTLLGKPAAARRQLLLAASPWVSIEVRVILLGKPKGVPVGRRSARLGCDSRLIWCGS